MDDTTGDPEEIARNLVRQLVDSAVRIAHRRSCSSDLGSNKPSRPTRPRSGAPEIPASWVWYRFVRLHAAIEDSSPSAAPSALPSSAFSSVGRLLAITGIHFRTAGQVRHLPHGDLVGHFRTFRLRTKSAFEAAHGARHVPAHTQCLPLRDCPGPSPRPFKFRYAALQK